MSKFIQVVPQQDTEMRQGFLWALDDEGIVWIVNNCEWVRYDDQHDLGQMSLAAKTYILISRPSIHPIRNLVKAGALIAAEIDRLQRTANPVEASTLEKDN